MSDMFQVTFVKSDIFKSDICLELHFSSATFVRSLIDTIYIDSYKLQLEVKSNIRRLTCHLNIYTITNQQYTQ